MADLVECIQCTPRGVIGPIDQLLLFNDAIPEARNLSGLLPSGATIENRD